MTTSEINFSPFGSQLYYEALDDKIVLQKLYHPLFSHKTNLLANAMQIGEYVASAHNMQISHYCSTRAYVWVCETVS